MMKRHMRFHSLLLTCFALLLTSWTFASEQPNILWLTAEDIGPELGCYGDSYADTPRLDAFARQSILYLNCWSNAPVCAPARTTLISGLYPPSTGSEHMRSLTRLPSGFQMYPALMREAGYFCVNPGKEDYNLEKVGHVWDQPDKNHPWLQLKSHQPFLAVFNHLGTHESKIRTRPHAWVHDPAKAPLPAYHPDTLEVRQDWAQYYDNITEMDRWFGQQLDRLQELGLDENTIVFFYGDHGSGMPRSKRWPYNSGLRVALLIRIPEKFKHLAPADSPIGGQADRLVSFVDLAPTLLSLAGKTPPDYLQGHAFLGPQATAPQPYLYGFRGRMDEREDLIRTVRNARYQYIRNYMPQLPYGQHVSYMFQTPTAQIWKELADSGQLNAAQSIFWNAKPPEELYDLQADPDEVHNLAGSAEHQAILDELRQAHLDHVLRIRDVGFLPEDELHSRAPDLSPYELGHNARLYPLQEILHMAELASLLRPEDTPALVQGLSAQDSAVRYWAACGLLARGAAAVEAAQNQLRRLLERDSSPNVKVVAAEALARFGSTEDFQPALDWLIEAGDANRHGPYVSLAALNAIDRLGDKARPAADRIANLPTKGDWVPGRGWDYNQRLIEHIQANLK